MHRLDFLKLCKYSSKPDFCLIWNATLLRPKYQYQYYLILKRFRHDVRTQLSCGITNSQAGKESPQAFKEQQQVLEKFLLASGWVEILAAPFPPPPAVLVLPWVHGSCPGLQVFLRFKETQILQNNNKGHKASWYKNRKLREEGDAVNLE